jgi:adenosine deaminase
MPRAFGKPWVWPVLILALVVIVLAASGAALALLPDSAITAARFSTLRNDHTALRAFLQRMPKGADLYVHLSGAVFAEDLIAWAAREGLTCASPTRPPSRLGWPRLPVA